LSAVPFFDLAAVLLAWPGAVKTARFSINRLIAIERTDA